MMLTFNFCFLYLSYYLLFSHHFLDAHLTQQIPILISHNLVVAHHSEDISWLKHVRRDLVKTVYVLTSGEEECKELISPVSMSVTKAGHKMELNQPELVCESIPKYGCEAGAYLSYLSRHYENLEEHTLFLHAHRSAWRNKLWLNPEKGRWKALRAEEIVHNHNWNTNFSYVFSHYMEVKPGSSKARHAAKIFPNDIIRSGVDVPGAAQFGLSRVRIHQYSQSTYERWNKEANGKFCGPAHSAGRGFANAWEILWPIVFSPKECVERYPSSKD